MEFSRQDYWSALPFPSLGDLSNPGIKPGSPALQPDSLPSELPGKPPLKKKKVYINPGTFKIYSLVKNLWSTPPRILEIKAKINKWDLIKLKASAQQKKL